MLDEPFHTFNLTVQKSQFHLTFETFGKTPLIGDRLIDVWHPHLKWVLEWSKS